MANSATAVDKLKLAWDASAIDRKHLSRVTFGDRDLERELLQLFARQAGLLVDRMRASEPSATACLAHTLKGSAAGVGATNVAAAAEAVERAAAAGVANCGPAVERLAQTIERARVVIAEMLRAN
jgi:HPt (histidine-containing phosphotransfer) domain-containing protein